MVEGSYNNIKITTPEDLVICQGIFECLEGSEKKKPEKVFEKI